jgi:hypothetical protein
MVFSLRYGKYIGCCELEKKIQLKILYIFYSKKASIKDVQATEKPSALKREHPALQKMKFINCFQFIWAIFALLDPDTDLYGTWVGIIHYHAR